MRIFDSAVGGDGRVRIRYLSNGHSRPGEGGRGWSAMRNPLDAAPAEAQDLGRHVRYVLDRMTRWTDIIYPGALSCGGATQMRERDDARDRS